MKRALILYPLLVGLCMLAGCGGSSNDALMRDTISLFDEMSAILEKSDTVKEAKPKLESLMAKQKDLKKRMDAAKITDAEKEALQKKYEPQMKKAMDRFGTAIEAIDKKDPGGALELMKMK